MAIRVTKYMLYLNGLTWNGIQVEYTSAMIGSKLLMEMRVKFHFSSVNFNLHLLLFEVQ